MVKQNGSVSGFAIFFILIVILAILGAMVGPGLGWWDTPVLFGRPWGVRRRRWRRRPGVVVV